MDVEAPVRLCIRSPVAGSAQPYIKPGNITHSSRQDSRRPSYSLDSLPAIREVTGRRFSTGIGGTGNITSVDKLEQHDEREEMARLLHDIQAPGIVLVDGPNHTGRGENIIARIGLRDCPSAEELN